MKNLCFLPLVHFLYSRCMNVENSRQSLSKGRLRQRLSDFALRAKRLGVTADPDGSNSRWRKQNIFERNIFREDTRSSHDILILMFFTSLGQCKVN